MASAHARLLSCVSYLFCYKQCTMIKLQLGLVCCVMSPIVSLADLAVFSVEGAGTANSSSQPTKRWDLLGNEYADMFETPSRVPDCKIKHRIDLIDINAQPPKPQQYCMSSV